MSEMFDEFWRRYPRKVAKKAAEKAFLRVVKKTPAAFVIERLDVMMRTEWRGRELQHVPYPATFLNGESFDLDARGEALEDEAEHKYGEHRCSVCKPAHVWSETGDPINWSATFEKTCPEQVAEMQKRIRSGLQSLAAQKSI